MPAKLTVEEIPFDLQDVLTSLADMFAYRAYDKDLEFIINLPANIPTKLIGDPLRLNQVLVNLISNAIKFTEDGEINVAVNLLDSSDEDVLLRIAVTDTGIGMDEEQRANLFKEFTQADINHAKIRRHWPGAGYISSVNSLNGRGYWRNQCGRARLYILYRNKVARSTRAGQYASRVFIEALNRQTHFGGR